MDIVIVQLRNKNTAGWDAGFKQIVNVLPSNPIKLPNLEKRYSVTTVSSRTPRICNLPPVSDILSQLTVLCFISTQLFIMKGERGGNLVIWMKSWPIEVGGKTPVHTHEARILSVLYVYIHINTSVYVCVNLYI